MAAQYSLHTQKGAWKLPTINPEGIYAAATLQTVCPGEWEIVEEASSSNCDPLPYLLPSASSNPFPLSALRSPNSHLAPATRATIHAFTLATHTNLSPFTLHTLYSLEANWFHITRPSLIASELGSCGKWYIPDRVRLEAKGQLEAEGLWGLAGGPAAVDEREELRRRTERTLAGKEAEAKIEFNRGFDTEKLFAKASAVLLPLATMLGESQTGYTFDSPTPTTLDLMIFSHLALILLPPWQQPLLADLIRNKFPILLRHTEGLRDTLFPAGGENWPPIRTAPTPALSTLASALGREVYASLPSLPLFPSTSKEAPKPKSDEGKKELDFAKNRRMWFAGVVVFGVAFGWSQGMLFGSGNEHDGDDGEE